MTDEDSKPDAHAELPEPPWRVLATTVMLQYGNGAKCRDQIPQARWFVCINKSGVFMAMEPGEPKALAEYLTVIPDPGNDDRAVEIIRAAKEQP